MKNTLTVDTLPPLNGTENISHDDLRWYDLDSLKRVDGELNGKQIDGIGAVMYAPNGTADNLLIYPTNGKYPHFATAYKSHAIKLGQGAVKVAVLGLDNAHALAGQTLGGQDLQVLTLPKNLAGYFASMVNKHAPKYVFTTHDHLEDLTAKVAGVDIISTVAELATALAFDDLDTLINADHTAHTANEWGEIRPLQSTKTNSNPYPVQAFGNLAPVVSAIATYARTPASMAGQSVLGVLSAIGQIFVNAPLGYDHKPASLYLLTESPSGGGKTTVSNLAYKAVYEYAKQRYKQFLEDLQEYQNALSQLKGKQKAEYINYHHEPKDDSPIIKDATTESIVDKFITGDTVNLAWATSEAGMFFGGYSLKSDTATNALGIYTTLWSDGEAHRLRKGKTATPYTRAYDCRFTLDLSGQRAILNPVMNDEILVNQGFLPRFLLSAEPSLIGERDFTTERNPYKDPHLIKFWERCRELLDNDSNQERLNMPFGKGARTHLSLYQQAIEYDQKSGARLANVRAFASRMAENASRIATLFAFFDGKDFVGIDELNRAFELVEYSINEVLQYNDRIDETPTPAQQLLAYIIKQCTDQQTERLLYSLVQSRITPKSLRRKEAFELAISALTDTNRIKVVELDGTRWIIANPKALNKYE